MTSAVSSATISTAEFVDAYPELFALYRQLVVSALSFQKAVHGNLMQMIGARALRIEERFARKLKQAKSAYELSISELFRRYQDDERTIKGVLEQTLIDLAAERKLAQEPFVKEAEEAGVRLHERFGTDPIAKICYHELGLSKRAFDRERDGDSYREASIAITRHLSEQKLPSEKVYSDKAAQAHENCNRELRALAQRFAAAIAPYQAIWKRQVKASERNRARALARKLEAETRGFQKMDDQLLKFRERRLKLVASFLERQDVEVLKDSLEAELVLIASLTPRIKPARFRIYASVSG